MVCNNGTIRFVDGPSESIGRVEICINEAWGTICDNGWDNNDATVVCRQAGYSRIGELTKMAVRLMEIISLIIQYKH